MIVPERGDFCCVSVGGAGGRFIGLAERACGSGFAAYQHAFVYVGGMRVVEAETGGARVRRIDAFEWSGQTVLWSTGAIDLDAAAREAICEQAGMLVGTGYSALDYGAIGLHHLGIPAPRLRAYIASTHHLICSQLVDQAYLAAGVHLFDDGRWPGYVMPADLAGLVLGDLR